MRGPNYTLCPSPPPTPHQKVDSEQLILKDFISNPIQHTWIEANLYQQMALCSHVLAFSYSKWNTESGEKRLVLQAAEATVGQPVSEVRQFCRDATIGPAIPFLLIPTNHDVTESTAS